MFTEERKKQIVFEAIKIVFHHASGFISITANKRYRYNSLNSYNLFLYLILKSEPKLNSNLILDSK